MIELLGDLKMIELRVVDNGPMCRPDFQYRYHRLEYDWYQGKVNPPFRGADWSEWQTAEWIKADDYQEYEEMSEND